MFQKAKIRAKKKAVDTVDKKRTKKKAKTHVLTV